MTAAGTPALRAELVPPTKGSPLSLESIEVAAAGTLPVGSERGDYLLFVFEGAGTLELGGVTGDLVAGSAALVLAGETAVATASRGLRLLAATVDVAAERHASLGERALTVCEEEIEPGNATGKRSFQLLYGPHNGSQCATLFLGYVPPGRAPWHYHLFDEIVLIRRGLARVHRADGTTEDAPAGAAFRLAPREVHVVENAGEEELALLGLFTPAGSPSAAYLPPEAATTEP